MSFFVFFPKKNTRLDQQRVELTRENPAHPVLQSLDFSVHYQKQERMLYGENANT